MGISLPNPGGIFPLPGVDLPGDNPSIPIPNPFDYAIDKIKDIFHDWLNSAFSFITNTYVHVPMPDNNVFSYYYGNSLGLASMLIIPLITILILWAWVRPKRSISVVQMVFVAILFGLVAPGWIGFCDNLRATGIQIADHITTGPIKTPRGGNDLIFFPVIGNIFADITGVIFVLLFGGLLVFQAFWFGLVGVLVKIIGPLALILYPLAEWTKKLGNWLIAIGLVSFLIMVPAGKLGLVIGVVGANSGPLSNFAAGQIMYLLSGIAIAFILPIWAVFILRRKVEQVAGDLGASVRGGVDATLRQQRPITTRAVSAANSASMRVPAPVKGDSVPRKIGRDVVAAGITVMAGKSLIEAAGKTTPTTAAVLTTAHAITRKRANRRNGSEGGDTPS